MKALPILNLTALIIIISLGVFSCLNAQSWQEISGNVPGDLSSDYRMPLASDGTRLYATGRTGVFVSNDQGNSFTAINDLAGENYDLSNIYPRFIKYVNGEVWVGFGGFSGIVGQVGKALFRLQPGSTEWQASGNGISVFDGSIEDIDYDSTTETYYAVASLGKVYVSTDNGQNWEARTNGLSGIGSPSSVVALDGKAFASRPLGGIQFTSDAGLNWSRSLDTGSDSPGSLIRHNLRLVMSAGLKIHYSDDFGATWETVSNVPHGGSMLTSNGTHIFASSRSNLEPEELAYSPDGGITWISIPNDGLNVRPQNVWEGYYVHHLLAHGDYLYLSGQSLNSSFLWVSSHLHRIPLEDIVLSSPALKDANALGNGWFDLEWLGLFHNSNPTHIFHDQFGWLFSSGSLQADQGTWLYLNDAQNWLWFTSSNNQAFAFNIEENAWYVKQGDEWIKD